MEGAGNASPYQNSETKVTLTLGETAQIHTPPRTRKDTRQWCLPLPLDLPTWFALKTEPDLGEVGSCVPGDSNFHSCSS